MMGVGYEHTVFPEEESFAKISSTEHWASLQDTMTYLGGTAKALDSALEIQLYFPQSIDR
jgi:hypothetical protein